MGQLSHMEYLNSAISAIADEIAILKEEAALCTQRWVALEGILREIGALEFTNESKLAGESHSGKWARKNDLPSTRGTFWQDQVTSTPQTWIEILDGAIAKLGISLNSDQRRRFRQRMIFTLTNAVQDGEIEELGTGRERRFFRQR